MGDYLKSYVNDYIQSETTRLELVELLSKLINDKKFQKDVEDLGLLMLEPHKKALQSKLNIFLKYIGLYVFSLFFLLILILVILLGLTSKIFTKKL